MKILFSHSYFLQFDPKQSKLGQPYAPLGTLLAAACMRSKGHTVCLFDTMFALSADEVIPVLEKERPDLFVIWDDGFNYLTKMCLTNMREAAFEMIRSAKKNKCTVIVNSSDASDHFEKYLDAGADHVINGEGEQTLYEFVEQLDAKEFHAEKINGLIYRKDGRTVRNAPREVLRELDELPLPAWDLADVKRYRDTWMKSSGYFSMNMATTRGCPFKCNWCAKPIYGNRYNTHSPQRIIDELKILLERYKPDHIWFCDDIFGLKPKWVNEFADGIEKEKIKIKFKIQSRVDLLLEENNIEALARAGCDTAWVGAESGSQKILDAMDKGTKVEQIYAATALLKKHNIRPAFFIQFGYLGETKEDIALTIQMLSDLLPDDIGVSVSYPLPGTPFYEKVKGELKEKTNWTDSDELALMFANTYSPAYYKQLHRYVHKNYRKKQALESIGTILRKPSALSAKKIRKAISLLYFTPTAFFEKQKLNKLN